jgi:hypothetical protein
MLHAALLKAEDVAAPAMPDDGEVQ